MNRLEWLRARQNGIGASDTPNLVGLGFQDAMSVYRSKIEPVTDREPDGLLALGLALESHIACLYQRAMGVSVEACGHSIARPSPSSWLFASPDFRREDGQYMQAKTVAGFGDEWGPNGSDEIPPGYRVQVMQEMFCTDTSMIDVAALCRITGEFRVYRVGFDYSQWHWQMLAAHDFWSNHVVPRVPPGLAWSQRFTERLPFARDKAIELPDTLTPLFEQRATFAAIGKEAEAETERLTAEIMRALGDGHKATCGEWKVTRVRTDDEIKPPEYMPERIVKGKDYLRITKGKKR